MISTHHGRFGAGMSAPPSSLPQRGQRGASSQISALQKGQGIVGSSSSSTAESPSSLPSSTSSSNSSSASKSSAWRGMARARGKG
ncbi:MAG: hypothetical protein DWI01_08440 [Planctomycetota bacterium]|nr:MAG: hypothetical protein DWI01_08440 [Planctomycetota bacterium]